MGLNVLISACSRKVDLVRGFKEALRSLGIRGKVLCMDIDPLSPAGFFADRFFVVPPSPTPEYAGRVMEIVEEEKVGLLVPTIDEELEVFPKLRARLKGCLVLGPDMISASVSNDKYKMYVFLSLLGIPVAETWMGYAKTYPAVLKPRFGKGSRNVFLVSSRDQEAALRGACAGEEMISQEYLPGDEYTLDVFKNLDGQVVEVVPRLRLKIREGVMDRGVAVKSKELMELGLRVAGSLKFVGPANFQVKYKGEEGKVIELNLRFSGGIFLTRYAGADFFQWCVKMALGEDVKPRIGAFKAPTMGISYDSHLIIGGITWRGT